MDKKTKKLLKYYRIQYAKAEAKNDTEAMYYYDDLITEILQTYY